MRFSEIHYFVIGFLFSSFLILIPFHIHYQEVENTRKYFYPLSVNRPLKVSTTPDEQLKSKFDESLSKTLYNDVKILCMVMTHPKNHQKKAIHIKNTWGRRCNKLLFMSSEEDSVLETIVLPVEKETRDNLWNKTKASFQYVHDNYLEEYAWFVKADDDNYIVVENLRYLLAQYNPNTAFYFGHRYAAQQVDEGYMAGGGYCLSRKAVQKFVEVLEHNEHFCHVDGRAEDVEMGRCLAHNAIFVDTRDEFHQKRFFPIGVEEHMKKIVDPQYWYIKSQYYHVVQGNISCCSDTSVEYHYIDPHEMYVIEYLIYDVQPFGINDHFNETLPQRLTLNEIIIASDAESSSPNFKHHKNKHNLDPSEGYKSS